MLRTQLLRRLALVAVIAMLATACGTDNGTDEPTDPDDPTPTEREAAGDGVLRLGYIVPETGALAFLGPPQKAAFELAVQEINAAGGVLDTDVEFTGGDEAGEASIVSQTAQRLLSENVDAIVGAASSGMSLAIIDNVTGAEVVQCSGSNTSPTFTNYDDGGFYFRTAPTDALQGPVLAETMVDDGHQRIALMARSDDYGQGLLNATRDALAEQGAEVVAEVIYDAEAATFDAEVQQVAGANPDAIAIIGFDEGAQILSGLIEAGVGPQDVGIYGADGLREGTLPELVDPNNPNVLDGMKGTAPDPGGEGEASQQFQQRLQEFAPDLTSTTFAAQVYDCVVIIALAAIAAGTDDAAVFKDHMVGVTRDGTACSSFEECKQLLEDGEEIDYNGASGPIDFNEAGEPETGTYEVWEFQNGELTRLDTVESRLT